MTGKDQEHRWREALEALDAADIRQLLQQSGGRDVADMEIMGIVTAPLIHHGNSSMLGIGNHNGGPSASSTPARMPPSP